MENKYKAKLRIPGEIYAFVEIEVEGTADEIATANQELKLAINGGDGLPIKEWRAFLDSLVSGNLNDVEKYVDTMRELSTYQKSVVDELRKSFNRVNYKNKIKE